MINQNYYNSDVSEKYYDIAENTNAEFYTLNQFNIFAKYIQEWNKLCEFWSWEWTKIASFFKLNRKLDLYWIDISEYGVEKSKKSYPQINYLVQDITKTSFKNSFFDITMSFFVFEHLSNPLLAFDEMFRTTKKWGYIFLWFPNYWSPLFPSPPSLYWKSVFQKICLILKRIFSKLEVYKNVSPIINVEFEPDFDTTAEIYMWKFIKSIQWKYNITILEEKSDWEDTEKWNILFKLYFPFKCFKNTFFKYWWPKCFLIIRKND